MSDEFVEPEVVRIPLSGENRWIEVRRELNAGEFDAMHAELVKDMRAGDLPVLDFKKVASYKVNAYLLDWSFADKAGKSIPVSPSAVANLKKKTRDEIAKAIEAHEEAGEQAIDERKNEPAPESLATSPSAEQ